MPAPLGDWEAKPRFTFWERGESRAVVAGTLATKFPPKGFSRLLAGVHFNFSGLYVSQSERVS